MRPTRHVVTGLILMLAPASAVAQPSVDSIADVRAGRSARLWSLGATVLPMAMMPMLANSKEPDMGAAMIMGLGIYMGPAVGYWKEGASQRGWMGVGVRFGIVMGAATVASTLLPDHPMTDEELDSPKAHLASLAFLGAGVGVLWSAVNDIRKADQHVRTARAKSRAARTVGSVNVIPAFDVASGRAALQARITF